MHKSEDLQMTFVAVNKIGVKSMLETHCAS